MFIGLTIRLEANGETKFVALVADVAIIAFVVGIEWVCLTLDSNNWRNFYPSTSETIKSALSPCKQINEEI